MYQYAYAWPEAISGSGEKVAGLLFAASGSKTVATDSGAAPQVAEVFELFGAPGEIRTPDPLVRSWHREN
jgi:hypothetical protein